ncbi:MAG: T9SS type A sorting domain-containing protein [Bacteroidota bacterium]
MNQTKLITTIICALLIGICNAQIEKIETYTVGTKITYYPNSCGADLPEADGKISFCDEADNLGVVEQSFGLNSNFVRKIIPNYFNDDEVFVTDLGFSIKKSDGSWQNLPENAIPTNSLSNRIVSEEGIVTPDGKLLYSDVNQSADHLGYLDLITLEFGTYLLGDADHNPLEFAHDSASGKTYILTRAGTSVLLYSLLDGVIVTEGVLSGIPQFSSNWYINAISDGFLYVGGTNGLYKIDLNDTNSIDYYGADDLPGEDVTDITVDSAGRVLIAYGLVNQGGIARFTPTTDTFEYFNIENPGNGEHTFKDIAYADDGTIWAVANTFSGVFTLAPDEAEPLWTQISLDDFEQIGFEIHSNFNAVDEENGHIYLTANGNPNNISGFDRPVEILKLTGEEWFSINDDETGNLSALIAYKGQQNDYQYVARAKDGGIWWMNSQDGVLAFLSDDEVFGINDFDITRGIPVVDNNGLLNAIEGSDLIRYNPPIKQEFDSDTDLGFGPDWITTYQDQVWLFDRQTDVLHVYVDDEETATYNLVNYDNNNPVSADSFGNVFYSEVDNGDDKVIINKYDPTNDTTTTIEFFFTTDLFPSGGSSALQQITLSDGKMAFLAGSTIFLYDDENIIEIVLEDLGFESFETIDYGAVDASDNLILILNSPKLVRMVDLFGGVNIETYKLGTQFSFSTEDSLLPELPFGIGMKIAVESDGGIWIHGGGEFAKFTLSNADIPPGDFESFRITGQVYLDSNDNEVFDEGEQYKNQRIALKRTGSSVSRVAVTRPNGQFTFIYDGTGDYNMTLLGSDPNVTPENITTTFNVNDVNQDTDLGDFKLQIRYIDGLLVKSSQKEGAWGFDREGFENTFATAIGNISSTKTFNNLEFQFLYKNEDDNSDNLLPSVDDVTLYRVTALSDVPVIYNTLIPPRSNNWSIAGSPNDFQIETLSLTPEINSSTDQITIDFSIPELSPRDMIVIEVDTGLFAPEQNGTVIEYGLSFVGGDNLDDNNGPLTIPLIPRPDDEPKLRLPEDIPPFPNPNDPNDNPFVPEGPVYAPVPKTIEIFSSYDPNDKLVTPGLPNVLNEVDINTQYLTYTIRFENEGNFSAKDVFILDEMDENLDLNSIQLIEASHDVVLDQLTLNGKTNIRFFFEDIFLDFTANDPVASQGYVKFAIRPIEGIALNTIVENTAAIYFDQNPPIITNTTQHQFVDLQLSLDDFSSKTAKAFPNPVEDILNLRLPISGDFDVRLFDLNGRELGSWSVQNKDILTMSLGHLAQGYYVINVKGSNKTKAIKILKQ